MTTLTGLISPLAVTMSAEDSAFIRYTPWLPLQIFHWSTRNVFSCQFWHTLWTGQHTEVTDWELRKLLARILDLNGCIEYQVILYKSNSLLDIQRIENYKTITVGGRCTSSNKDTVRKHDCSCRSVSLRGKASGLTDQLNCGLTLIRIILATTAMSAWGPQV